MRVSSRNLSWRRTSIDWQLMHDTRKTGYIVVRDPVHDRMWRVKSPDGKLSDMVNLTRAKDAADFIYRRVMEFGDAGKPPGGVTGALKSNPGT